MIFNTLPTFTFVRENEEVTHLRTSCYYTEVPNNYPTTHAVTCVRVRTIKFATAVIFSMLEY
jgi:hypothetical protein